MVKRALYFGFGSGGHFLRIGPHDSTLHPEHDVPGFPWSIDLLDTGLLKNRGVPDSPDGRVHWVCGGKPDFWFGFFWWDRSGDRRPGSNSGFYVLGFGPALVDRQNVETMAPAAFEFACQQWPEVVARQVFPLVLEGSADGGNHGQT